MKRIIAILLALAMLFILAACNGGAGKVTQTEDSIPSNNTIQWSYPIMENDSGYYYYAAQGFAALRYYDRQSGNDIICCNKPECAHDGNPYCAATSAEYDVITSGMYDGAVYTVVSTTFEQVLENSNTFEMKLLRNEPDGTLRSEVCTFLTLKNAMWSTADFQDGIILHRGKAFVDYSYHYTDMDGMMVGDPYYGKMIIDLATGEYYEMPWPDTLKKEDIIFAPHDSRIDGDWVYYVIVTYDDELNHCSIYRWNYVTQETEKLDIPPVFSSYTVNDGIVYYAKCDLNDKENKSVQIYKHIPETGITEKFTEMPIPVKNIIESSIIGPNNNQPEVTTDREYLYYVNFGMDSIISNDPEAEHYCQPECIIYSFDGQELARFMLPIEPRSDFEMYTLNVVNGTVYYQSDYDVHCCSVEDILAGTVEWTKLYDLK